ncbi:MAG: tetratricopeptide repeat protein [Prosthecobacter sp.]
MRSVSLLFVICGILFTSAGLARAQAIVLKDGSKVFSNEFSLEGEKIIRTIKIGEATAKSEIMRQNIDSLEWPYPAELTDSQDLLAKGKTEEAITVLKKGKDFFEKFKEVEGNWYVDVFFAYIEALNTGGKFDDVIKLMPSARNLKLTDAQKLRLRIIQLDIDRQTSSDFLTVVAEAESILKETDDSAIGAALWNIIADVHVKKKEWEKALLAYLRIPVFYGSQVQRVPEAELQAALMLVKMGRFEDANSFFTRLIASYPSSLIAERATKEKASIAGMKNDDPSKQAKDQAKNDQKNEKPAEGGEKPKEGAETSKTAPGPKK